MRSAIPCICTSSRSRAVALESTAVVRADRLSAHLSADMAAEAQSALEVEFPVSDLINSLYGFSGNVFAWSDGDACYNITDNTLCEQLLHPSDVDQARRFLPMASHHKALADAVQSCSASCCPYEGAFVTGIESCLCRYYAHLNKLEEDRWTISKQPVSAFLSLLRFDEIVCQIKRLWDRVVTKKEMTYSSLLSHACEQRETGSEEWRACFQLLFQSLLNVLYDDIWSWLMYGHLSEESRGIFFIRETEDDGDVRLEATDLPVIVDNLVALKILFTGNLVRYFSSFASDAKSVFGDKEQHFARAYLVLREKAFSKWSFAMFVEKVRKEAAKFSSRYVMQEEGILQHFSVMKQVFLTGNENLWTFFVDKVSDLCDKKCEHWSDAKKDKFLRTTIESILLKFYWSQEDVDAFLNDFKFSFKFAADKSTVFSLDYTLPPLTKRIVKAHLMEKYQRIFNFMLKLFRSRQELSRAWIRHMRKRSRLCLLRHQLLHFVNHLSYYLKVNVIETQVREFLMELHFLQDYEEMQLRHSAFLSLIMREMFLDYPAVEEVLLRMFALVHRLFQDTAAEPSETEVRRCEQELKQMMHDLDLLFGALRDFRGHSSLCQLLLQMKVASSDQ